MSRRPTIGFVTCVQLGLSCIEEIYEVGGSLDFVMTLSDDVAPGKSGRVFLDDFSRRKAIPLIKIRNINDAKALDELRSRRPDWLFIVGWSQIAGPSVLAAVTRGVLGMHPTLLPQGRGRAAVPWAILKGLRETGVTLFKLDEGVDTGPIIRQLRVPIAPNETAATLYAKVAAGHRQLIRLVWNDLVAGQVGLTPQDEGCATVWPARTPRDGRLNSEMTCDEMDRLVRATTRPYPGAFIERDDRLIRVWSGRPARPGTPAPHGALRLDCRDGSFDALEYDVEVDRRTVNANPVEESKP